MPEISNRMVFVNGKHPRVTSSIKLTSTHLYVRVKCQAQEHHTKSPARAWTWATRPLNKHSNHVTTAPPHSDMQGRYINTYQHVLDNFKLLQISDNILACPYIPWLLRSVAFPVLHLYCTDTRYTEEIYMGQCIDEGFHSYLQSHLFLLAGVAVYFSYMYIPTVS